MTYFHIEIDNKFKELIKKKKNYNINDLIELKSFIYEIYQKENTIEDLNIKNGFKEIIFKI
jgi:hypothetical protein